MNQADSVLLESTLTSTMNFIADLVCGKLVSVKNQPHKYTELLVYPNPAIDEVTLEVLSETQKSLVQLFDISGKQLLEKTITSKTTLSLNEFSSGIYFLKVSSNSNTSTQKLVVK